MKANANKFSVRDLVILTLILIFAFTFRLYKIDIPLADLYSSRQAETAAVTRNFVNKKFNLLIPVSDNLSPLQSGKESFQGLDLSEFSLYSGTVAFFAKYLPFISLEIYGRLTTAFFSLILIAIIYLLLLKENGRVAAASGALVYSFFPYFVFFSRLILPYTMALTYTFLGLIFVYYFSQGKNSLKNAFFLILAILFTASGLLISSYMLLYLLPTIYLFWRKYRWEILKQTPFYLFFVLSLLPLALWINYVRHFPEGIQAGIKLFSNFRTFWHVIFFDRLNNLILGGYLTFFFILGVLAKSKRQLFLSLLLTALVFILFFQNLNLQGAYYQTLILPVIAIFVGLGTDFIFKNSGNFRNPVLVIFVSAFLFILSFFISYREVRNWYAYPKDLVSIANIIQDLTNQNDKIITETNGDMTLLYLANRRGSPVIYKDLEQLKQEGYSYLATMNQQQINKLKANGQSQLVFSNEKFALFKL